MKLNRIICSLFAPVITNADILHDKAVSKNENLHEELLLNVN